MGCGKETGMRERAMRFPSQPCKSAPVSWPEIKAADAQLADSSKPMIFAPHQGNEKCVSRCRWTNFASLFDRSRLASEISPVVSALMEEDFRFSGQ